MTDAERACRYRARRKRGRSLEQRFDTAVHALENLWSALLDAGTVADTKDLRDAGTGYPVRRELCRAPSARPRDRFCWRKRALFAALNGDVPDPEIGPMISKTKTTVITAALLVLISSPAMAQCAQDQLAGNWTLLGSTAAGAWNRCDVEIDPAGAYTGVCIGTNRPRRGDEVNGTLRLRRTCELRGAIAGEDFRLPLNGVLLESGDIGAGINRFGDPELNLGLLFTLIRRPAAP